jgi:hypothetical protein
MPSQPSIWKIAEPARAGGAGWKRLFLLPPAAALRRVPVFPDQTGAPSPRGREYQFSRVVIRVALG